MTPLDTDDAILLARKMDDVGLVIQGFSEKSLDRRGRLIQDKERGFNGDLLSALFSLTTHENFEKKIFEEYQNLPSALARRILDVISIVNKYGLSIPIDYVAGFTGTSVSEVMRCLKEDLDGMAQVPEGSSSVRCRHRVIAEYYFRECISGQGDVTSLISILEFLSRQFTVDDIKTHPFLIASTRSSLTSISYILSTSRREAGAQTQRLSIMLPSRSSIEMEFSGSILGDTTER